MTLHEAYGDDYIVKFLLDLTGLGYAFGFWPYNPTWWFYSCILILYMVFPILYRIKNKLFALLVIALFAGGVGRYFTDYNILHTFKYLGVFILGVIMATYKVVPHNISKKHKLLFFIAFIIVSYIRIRDNGSPIIEDIFLNYLLVILYVSINLPKFVSSTLSFIGVHSFNIFLFHTIIQRSFTDVIYISHNPIIIYIAFITLCLAISFVYERVKNTILRFKIK